MTGILISKFFENVGPMIAIYSQFSSGLLTSFIFENKKSVRKAAYFYRMLKKMSNIKKINHGHGHGIKTMVKARLG